MSAKVCRLFGLSLLVFASRVGSLQGDEKWKQRFLKEAPENWQRYVEFSRQVSGHTVGETGRDGKATSHWRREFNQNDGCRIAVVQNHLPSTPDGHVFGANRSYAFSLFRKTQDEDWVLRKLEIRRSGVVTAIERDFMRTSPGLPELVSARGVQLADLIKRATFKLLDVSPVDEDGRQLVRVRFDNSHPLQSLPFCPVQGGLLYLDPDHCWCVSRYEVKIKGLGVEGDSMGRFKIARYDDAYPIPELFTEETIAKVSGAALEPGKEPHVEKVKRELRYDLRVARNPPGDDDFTLTAFGLPEPVGMPPIQRGTRWWWWMVLAAVVSVVLAALYRKLKRGYEVQDAEAA